MEQLLIAMYFATKNEKFGPSPTHLSRIEKLFGTIGYVIDQNDQPKWKRHQPKLEKFYVGKICGY